MIQSNIDPPVKYKGYIFEITPRGHVFQVYLHMHTRLPDGQCYHRFNAQLTECDPNLELDLALMDMMIEASERALHAVEEGRDPGGVPIGMNKTRNQPSPNCVKVRM